MHDDALESGTASPLAEEALETAEIVGISEELFTNRLDSLENILFGNFVLLCLILGGALAALIMRWFHVH